MQCDIVVIILNEVLNIEVVFVVVNTVKGVMLVTQVWGPKIIWGWQWACIVWYSARILILMLIAKIIILVWQVLTGLDLVIWLSLLLVLVLCSLAISGICCWAQQWVWQVSQRLMCVFNVSALVPLIWWRFNGFFLWWYWKC